MPKISTLDNLHLEKYIQSKSISLEEKNILNKGISKEADNIIIKYMIGKNNKVSPTTTKDDWLKYKPEIKKYLLNRFKDKSGSIKEIIYRIYYHIEEIPKCPVCGNPLSFLGKSNQLYHKYCSHYCSVHSLETQRTNNKNSLLKWGTLNPSQSIVVKNKISKSLKENSDIRKENQKKAWIKKYKIDNPMKLDLFKDKSDNTKRKNNSYGKSQRELDIYNLILKYYPNTKQQYKSKKYPFKCDYYIPEKDLYIEYQGFWTHGDHPFNPKDNNDIHLLEEYKIKEKYYLYSKKVKHTTYTDAINTWIKLDPKKREIAKKNNINYLEIWKNNDSNEYILNEIEKFPNINKN